jgi:hypothetical protein
MPARATRSMTASTGCSLAPAADFPLSLRTDTSVSHPLTFRCRSTRSSVGCGTSTLERDEHYGVESGMNTTGLGARYEVRGPDGARCRTCCHIPADTGDRVDSRGQAAARRSRHRFAEQSGRVHQQPGAPDDRRSNSPPLAAARDGATINYPQWGTPPTGTGTVAAAVHRARVKVPGRFVETLRRTTRCGAGGRASRRLLVMTRSPHAARGAGPPGGRW